VDWKGSKRRSVFFLLQFFLSSSSFSFFNVKFAEFTIKMFPFLFLQFTEEAKKIEGSGWVWLLYVAGGDMIITGFASSLFSLRLFA
jgi:hypothetical protein